MNRCLQHCIINIPGNMTRCLQHCIINIPGNMNRCQQHCTINIPGNMTRCLQHCIVNIPGNMYRIEVIAKWPSHQRQLIRGQISDCKVYSAKQLNNSTDRDNSSGDQKMINISCQAAILPICRQRQGPRASSWRPIHIVGRGLQAAILPQMEAGVQGLVLEAYMYTVQL